MKKLIGSDIGEYVFDPLAKTIEFTGLPVIDLSNILVITNVTAGAMVYNFADPALGGLLADNILTLDYDTTAMDAADVLQIWADLPAVRMVEAEQYSLDPAFVTDTNLMQVFGSQPIVDNQGVRCSNTWKSNQVVGALSGLKSELRINCTGMNTVAIQITGTWVGIIYPQASINGADFATAQVVSIGGGTAFTSITVNGQQVFNCSGMVVFRVLFNTYTSGTAIVTLVASAAKPTNVPFPSFQVTEDNQLPTIFGATQLYSPDHTEISQPIVNPVINPTQPTTYAIPKFANYPQKYRRLRVQIGGDRDLPLSQEPDTNRLLIAFPELYAKIEELLMQQILTNQLLAQAFGLQLPTGINEII